MKAWMVSIVMMAFCLRISCAQDDTRQALAEELLVLMRLQDSLEKSFELVKKNLPGQIQQMSRSTGQPQSPGDAARQAEKVMELVAAEMTWDKLKDDYGQLYAQTFSEQELRDLVEFYKSPAGRSFAEKQPELMQRSMEISQRTMMKILPKIQDPNWLRNTTSPQPPPQPPPPQRAPMPPPGQAVERTP